MAARAMGVREGALDASTSLSHHEGGIQRKCSACEDEQNVQRKASEKAAPTAAAPGLVSSVIGSPGKPLDRSIRGFMEQRFGQDFSRVRIHADDSAAASALGVSAHAYTVGNHIVFGRGQYAPTTQGGKLLLAHELAHTVQQGAAPGGNVLQRRAICPPGVKPEEGTGCRSEAGTCSDLLQASAPQGTAGCWDATPAAVAPPPEVAPTPAPAPAAGATAPSPAPRFDTLKDWNVAPPDLTGVDPARQAECQTGLCHARHPNMMSRQVTNDCFNDPDTGQCRSREGRCDRTFGYCPKNAKGAACKCMKM